MLKSLFEINFFPIFNSWETYSIKLPKNDKINVILEFKFEHLRVQTDYIAINNINIVDKRRGN